MGLLEILIALLVLTWLGGSVFHIAGNLVHLLLVAAVVLFFVRIFSPRSI